MPQRDEEMRKRQERRKQQQAKRAAEQKRMKRMLILAVLVLIVCGAGLFYMVGSAEPAEESVQQNQVQKETKPVETTKPKSPVFEDPITTIHIKAAGDLNVTDEVINAGLAINGYDYSGAFKDVSAILSDADLTVMNFEGNIYGEPYGTQTTSAPMQLLTALRGCGVDLLQMANSCAINNGLNGLTATLQAIRAAGMEPVGAFSSDAEFSQSKGYTITEIQDIRVAFVAFTKGLGGRGMPAGNENLVNLLYEDYATEYKKVNRDGIKKILKNVANEDPDLTVAMVHWGSEYSEYSEESSGTQRTIISLMKKHGVDVILGTHPHVVHPIVYDETDSTLVAYSLGDFFGDADRGATNYSIILDIEITKDASAGTTRVTDYSYTPIYTVKKSECVDRDHRVVRIDKAIEAWGGNYLDKITDDAKAGMDKALTRIGERVVMPEEED